MKTIIATEQQYFYHPDHLGSSSFITDASGDAHQHLQYLPFGEDFISQRIDWQTRYTFSAKEKDKNTGYHYFGARYYDSDVSVWLSVDDFSDKYPDLTPYHYGANNPILYIDPTGDTIVVNKYGDITRNDETDNLVYMQDGDRFEHIGEVGDNIEVDDIMENLLAKNSEKAKDMNLWDFKAAVQKGSDWDLKNNYDDETGKGSIFGYAWVYDDGKADKTTFTFGNYSNMTAADVGNYHFGYFGIFADIPKYILWKGAGFAETIKEWNEGNKLKAVWRANMLLTPLNRRSGDRKEDFKWTTSGMNDAKEMKRR